MASTVLGDVSFASTVFSDHMAGTFTDRLGFLTGGVLRPFAITGQKGYYAEIPKWDTLTGDSVQITTSTTSTINNLGDAPDIAVWVEREKAWAADQMISVVAGLDTTREIASQIGQYWANEVHKSFINVVNGCFDTELATTHSTGATYSGATITVEGGLAAKYKLGDNMDRLTTFLCNSKVHTDAVKDKIVTYDTGGADSLLTGQIPFFLGGRVVVTDKLEAATLVYPSYFAAPGAGIYSFRPRTSNSFGNANTFTISAAGISIEVELYRKADYAGGQDYLISRASYLTHIPGVQYDGTGGTNPTNATLATGTSWTKVYSDDKLIPIVQLKTL